MLKKWILLISCVAAAAPLEAATLTFVTRMSSPTASFGQVDTWGGAQANVVALRSNLANAPVDVALTASNANLGAVTLQANSILHSKGTRQFRASGITLKGNGTLKGKNVLIRTLTGASTKVGVQRVDDLNSNKMYSVWVMADFVKVGNLTCTANDANGDFRITIDDDSQAKTVFFDTTGVTDTKGKTVYLLRSAPL